MGAGGGVGKHEHRDGRKDGEGEPSEVGEGPHADGQRVEGLELAAQAQLADSDEDPDDEQGGAGGVEHEGKKPTGIGVVEHDHDGREEDGQADGGGGNAVLIGGGEDARGLAAGG